MIKSKNIEEIFNTRTCYEFSDQKIDREIIIKIYDLAKLGATSANSMPLRILFIESQESKKKLLSSIDKGNIKSVQEAPMTAIFAYDLEFYKKMNILFPSNQNLQNFYAKNTAIAKENALRNSSLQAAYFMIIAKAFGIGCGPMSGFNHTKLNQDFFYQTSHRVNFICNLGYKKIPHQEQYARNHKLHHDETCKFL